MSVFELLRSSSKRKKETRVLLKK